MSATKPLSRRLTRAGVLVPVLALAVALGAVRVTAPASAAADPDADADVVLIATSLGNIYVQVLPHAAPQSSAAFLARAGDGTYPATTFVHRAYGPAGSAGAMIQGGLFYVASGNTQEIVDKPTVPHETGIPDARGTIALATSADPDSASTSWFINDSDNSTTYSGSTAFGRVVYGMDVVDEIAALRKYDGSDSYPDFGSVPVTSASGFSYADLVYTKRTTDVGPLSGVHFEPGAGSPPPTTTPPAYHLTAGSVSAPAKVKRSAPKIAVKLAGVPKGSSVTVTVKIPKAKATAKLVAKGVASTKVVVHFSRSQRAHLASTHAKAVKIQVRVAAPGRPAATVTKKVKLG